MFFRFLYLDELVKEQNSSTLAHDSDEILMKSDLYPLENDKYMFSKDLNYKVNIHYIHMYKRITRK